MPKGAVAISSAPPPLDIHHVPHSLRFPLAVLLNLTLSALLYSFTSDFRAGDLSSVSRSINEWWEVLGLLGGKIAEFAIGWYGDYDRKCHSFISNDYRRWQSETWADEFSLGVDVACLTFLSHMPTLYLLTTFYGIRRTIMTASLLIDILAAYIPFYALRPVLPSHSSEAPAKSVSNRSILNDWPISIFTTILAAGIYGIVIYGSFITWIPTFLVNYFDGVRDLSGAYSAVLPFMIFWFLPHGYAAMLFMFIPATGAKPDLSDIRNSAFNPETATLSETVVHNLWGYSKRTRTLIKRTATLAALSGLYTWFQVYVTVEGAEGYGGAGWASIWVVATALTGMAFWWVGDVESFYTAYYVD